MDNIIIDENTNILILSNDNNISNDIINCFNSYRCIIDIVNNITDVIDNIYNKIYDIFFIDSSLIDDSYNKIIWAIRNIMYYSNSIIIIEKNRNLNKINFYLENGADDFIFYPFINEFLFCKIRSLVRKTRRDTILGNIKYNKFELNSASRNIIYNNSKIHLRPFGFKFLVMLVLRHPNILYINELLHIIYGQKNNSSYRVQLMYLKKSLEEIGFNFIETVSHIGYRINNKLFEMEHDEFNILIFINKKNETINLLSNNNINKIDYVNDELSVLEKIKNNNYSIIIIDSSILNFDIFKFSIKLRNELLFNNRIIALVNDDSIGNRLLNIGVDDYFIFPIGEYFYQRINAFIRREQKNIIENSFICENIYIDNLSYKIFIDNKIINFTQSEYKILYLLCKNYPYYIKFKDLFLFLYGNSIPKSGVIRVLLSNIRKKIAPFGYEIETVRTFGIRLVLAA